MSSRYVEMLHDDVVCLVWPGIEPIGPGQLRDAGLLGSAVARPFQSAFGQEIHGTIPQKASALFHSLIANHPFQNGNKRTALIALFHFLIANSRWPALPHGDMYDLAKRTATYRAEGIGDQPFMEGLAKTMANISVPFVELRKTIALRATFERAVRDRLSIRRHRLNRQQPPE